MRTYFCIFLVSFLGFSCQTKSQKVPENAVIKQVQKSAFIFNGNVSKIDSIEAPEIQLGWRFSQGQIWKDIDGEHAVVAWIRGPSDERIQKYTEGEKYAELWVLQYKKTGDQYVIEWQAKDAVRNCAFDMWLQLLNQSFHITDLDSNGKTEVCFLYQLTCRSDVSPSEMKLLMYDQGVKMALRGQMFLEISNDTLNKKVFEPNLSLVTKSKTEDPYISWGRYKNDHDFQGKPVVFLQHARKLWIEFCTQDQIKQF